MPGGSTGFKETIWQVVLLGVRAVIYSEQLFNQISISPWEEQEGSIWLDLLICTGESPV